MRTNRGARSRTMVIGAALAMVVAAGCADDGDDTAPTVVTEAPATATSDTEPVETAVSPTSSPNPAPDTTPDTSASATTPPTAAVTTQPVGPLPEPAISLVEIGTFDQPVEVAIRAGDVQVYVVEQPGRVVAVTDLSNETVLDITDLTDAASERGLLGLAFHPTENLAYVDYTDGNGDTVVAEFAVDASTGMFDRATQREVLTVDQPYANHNGGELAFGPDGMLYIGLGDGGDGGDPDRVALDLTSRLGKILRIDPLAAGDQPFTVPADNPFVDADGADPTIWSLGLRNPWRFSFDPVTGDLWIADVGQRQYEEIDHAPATGRADAGKGLNFGWSAFEGFEVYNDDQPTDGAVAPRYVYSHDGGRCSVSGGAVARGGSVPDLEGWYVFGDYCSGEIWGLDPTAPADAPRVVPLGQLAGLAAVAAGPEGELYAVSNAGVVARLSAA